MGGIQNAMANRDATLQRESQAQEREFRTLQIKKAKEEFERIEALRKRYQGLPPLIPTEGAELVGTGALPESPYGILSRNAIEGGATLPQRISQAPTAISSVSREQGQNPFTSLLRAQQNDAQIILSVYPEKRMEIMATLAELQEKERAWNAQADYASTGTGEDISGRKYAYSNINNRMEFMDTGEPVPSNAYVPSGLKSQEVLDQEAATAEALRQQAERNTLVPTSELEGWSNETGGMPDRQMTRKELLDSGFSPTRNKTERDKVIGYAAGNMAYYSDQIDVLLDTPGYDPTSPGEAATSISAWTSSPEYQQLKAASDEWSTNLVFLRSGATARQEEKDSAMDNYFPKPGNAPSTVRAKRRNRYNQMMNALAIGLSADRVSANQAIEQMSKLQSNLDIMDQVDRAGLPDNIDQDIWDFLKDPEKIEILKERGLL
tara:strand:- start:1700 stop:3004 length:1305 start_codon:yes stop_codon:yes gene_type:complete